MPGGFRRKRAREEQRVRVDGNGLMRGVVGEAGLGADDLATLGARIAEGAALLERHHRAAFTVLPPAKGNLKRAVQLADQVRGSFDDLVVLANGDLALGIRAVASALAPHAAEPAKPPRPRLHMADPLDPDAFAALLASLDSRRTLFNVIGARGDALPTIARFVIVRERLLRELGALAYQQHVVITTAASDGPLRQIVNDEGFRDLTLPSDVDEDAMLLTGAALFPLVSTGIDGEALAAGAADMAERCRASAESLSPAQLLAAGLLAAGGADPRVITTPAALRDLATWIARRARAGETEPQPGARPLTVFLRLEHDHEEMEIPKTYADLDGVGYLGGQGLATLAARQEDAEEIARWHAGQPTLALRCPERSASVVGQIAYLVEAASTLARAARGAATAEPADAIRLAYGLAGRPGYEAERAEAQRLAAHREARYVV